MEDEATALFDQRAGMLEYECGLSRDEAERLAWLQINNTIH
ncbi:hypothetical protein [Bosea caraganae]|nr:hypothetical protein [Bosea caraganae]